MWSLTGTDGAGLASRMPLGRPHLHLVTDERPNDHADEWTTWMRAGSLSERTIADRVSLVHRAAARTGTPPSHLTGRGLAVFLAQPMTPGTRQTYHSALKAWHRWLILAGYRDDDPTLLLPTPRVPRRHPRPVTTEHLRVLLGTRMKRRTRAMILLCAYQGLRVGEACSIRGEAVDLVGDRLSVAGKGGVERTPPLHDVVREVALGYPRRGWWFPAHGPNRARPDGQGPILPRSASTIVSNVMARAGVPGTAHCLRHWAATEMLRQGADARVVQEVLGHASLATTALYLEVNVDQQREAIAQLPRLA